MTTVQRSALLAYSAQQMYDLINDIEAYPQYLPGCESAQLLRRVGDEVEARLVLAKAGMRLSFTTRNVLHPPQAIEMRLLDGPFTDLRGKWTIQALREDACKVSLDLSFHLQRGALGAAAKLLFNPMADSLVDAMVKRAGVMYGR